MKTLLIMRHAKSSWKNPDLDDHRRPLNRRGKRDAPRMGQFLTDQDLIPDLVISSDAKRAITTARHVVSSNGSDGTIVTSDVLYHASPSGMLEVVSSVNDDSHCLLLVAHNPGIEDLVHLLTGEFAIMPTAAIAQVDLEIDKWSETCDSVSGTLVDVWRPKELWPDEDV